MIFSLWLIFLRKKVYRMRGETNRGAICGIIGIVAAITGVVLIFFGNYMANGYSSFYINLDYYYQTGTFDTTGKNLVTAGIVLIVIGAVLLFLSLYFAIKERKQFSEKIHNQDYDEFDDMVAQLAGNRSIFDVFHSEDHNRIFSFYRNKTCIFKKGDEVYRGKMEAIEREGDRPTVWRITLDYHGKKAICEIRKDEGDIIVKNRLGEEKFYRGK